MLLTKTTEVTMFIKNYDNMEFYSNKTFTLIFLDSQNETDYKSGDPYTTWCVDSEDGQ